MNATVRIPGKRRIAISPYARRLAHERNVDLDDVTGSGPSGRIVAADVLSHRPSQLGVPPEQHALHDRAASFTFVAPVSLTDFNRLGADAARVGLDIEIEDVAARAALAGMAGSFTQGLAIEATGCQIMIRARSGLSIKADRSLRQVALESGADVSAEPASASLLVLHAARVVPGVLPLLPGRALRFVLVVDRGREQGHALLCAASDTVKEEQAIAMLETFVTALEQPLALLA